MYNLFRVVNDRCRAITPLSRPRTGRIRHGRAETTKSRVTKVRKNNGKRGIRNAVIIHSNMIFHSRISVSWVWAVLGLGCLMRSRHCRTSIMITPIRITQTTNPPMIRISCQSTGINAKRHGRLKSRLYSSPGETFRRPRFFHFSTFFVPPLLSPKSSRPVLRKSAPRTRRHARLRARTNARAPRIKLAAASARDCLTMRAKFRENARGTRAFPACAAVN